MTIEVKQMIIKSTVVDGSNQQERDQNATVDLEQLKEILMEECKTLIADSLSELQER